MGELTGIDRVRNAIRESMPRRDDVRHHSSELLPFSPIEASVSQKRVDALEVERSRGVLRASGVFEMHLAEVGEGCRGLLCRT
jgi:hypothetical protein